MYDKEIYYSFLIYILIFKIDNLSILIKKKLINKMGNC